MKLVLPIRPDHARDSRPLRAARCRPTRFVSSGIERETFARREFRQATVGVDLQIAEAIDDRHPFRTNMGELRGVLLERRVAVGIAVGVESQPHFVVRRFLARMRGGRSGRTGFFAACRAGPNFSQSGVLAGACPAGFFFCNDFSWPFNCRSENGSCSCGATKSVCTKRTVARKTTIAGDEQRQAQPRPAFASRIGENKRRDCVARDLVALTRGYCRLDRAEENSGRNEHGIAPATEHWANFVPTDLQQFRCPLHTLFVRYCIDRSA